MDEIEIKRGDAEHEHQDCGYEDPQDTLDYKSSILWDHNDLRPIGASQKYTGAVVWTGRRKAIYRAEYTTE